MIYSECVWNGLKEPTKENKINTKTRFKSWKCCVVVASFVQAMKLSKFLFVFSLNLFRKDK